MAPHDYDGLLTPPTDPFDDWFADEHDSNGVRLDEDVDETVEDDYSEEDDEY
jgi:hypothetical protein